MSEKGKNVKTPKKGKKEKKKSKKKRRGEGDSSDEGDDKKAVVNTQSRKFAMKANVYLDGGNR